MDNDPNFWQLLLTPLLHHREVEAVFRDNIRSSCEENERKRQKKEEVEKPIELKLVKK